MDLKKKIFIFILCLLSILFTIYFTKKMSDVYYKQYTINNIYGYKKKSHLINNNYVIIKTDKLLLYINLNNANIITARLLNYKDTLRSANYLTLLNHTKNYIYAANSFIIKTDQLHIPDRLFEKIKFFTSSSFYQLAKDKNILKVPFFYVYKNIVYTKTFIFKKNSFLIKIHHQIVNNTNNTFNIQVLNELQQTPSKSLPFLNQKYMNFFTRTFRGIIYSIPNVKYQKYLFNKILNKHNMYVYTNTGGWFSIIQQYFATVWILPTKQHSIIYTKKIKHDLISIRSVTFYNVILPRQIYHISMKLWLGPKITQNIPTIVPLNFTTIDYGYLWFLSRPLFILLNYIFIFTKNWGLSIIVITCIMRIITYPLSKIQYMTIMRIRILQPKIQKLKIQYKNNKKIFNKELIKLYQKESLNPLSGFLPFLIQMPIFLALYYVLVNAIELRHAPFLLWIKDLSAEDPLYILPIVMSITIFYIQKMSSNNYNQNIDLIQKYIMYIMPFVFSIFFLWFPSGLILYYIISNIITILQQNYIYRKIN
ncbi:membrane protein insertase YidC [Enterobacteriaceae endosymbiont of Macroplea appendiculata]|uniref:membrane protein insertase YidC n=1 Tax=Enterobacteriaceae endosymbiont of Macroplea appendiculata TaxID=2675790 RepID=UPI001449E86F|nr:membrane protein insertase YidC [Enterobacteriaceae endosymbiont of Macroplea appendiculata]QJC31013.1 membrane protein insertase YidC [Enterobacteriaceae endosymbiont of Macroplea appendiculata]